MDDGKIIEYGKKIDLETDKLSEFNRLKNIILEEGLI